MNKQPELDVDCFGTKRWYLNGIELHREDGPAVERADGSKYWLLNNKRHRIDGPAFDLSGGDKYWFLDDKEYSEEEWFQQLTPEQQYNYLWNLDIL
jgi:hypothetical protein